MSKKQYNTDINFWKGQRFKTEDGSSYSAKVLSKLSDPKVTGNNDTIVVAAVFRTLADERYVAEGNKTDAGHDYYRKKLEKEAEIDINNRIQAYHQNNSQPISYYTNNSNGYSNSSQNNYPTSSNTYVSSTQNNQTTNTNSGKLEKVKEAFKITKNMWPDYNPKLKIDSEYNSAEISIDRTLNGWQKPEYKCGKLENQYSVDINGVNFRIFNDPSTINLFTYL
jgi:hypothetical protein